MEYFFTRIVQHVQCFISIFTTVKLLLIIVLFDIGLCIMFFTIFITVTCMYLFTCFTNVEKQINYKLGPEFI